MRGSALIIVNHRCESCVLFPQGSFLKLVLTCKKKKKNERGVVHLKNLRGSYTDIQTQIFRWTEKPRFLLKLCSQRLFFFFSLPALKKNEKITDVIHCAVFLNSDSAVSCSCDRLMHPLMTFCSIYPHWGRLSHLVHPKGETCRYTMASLNPAASPSWPFSASPFHPMWSVVEAVQTAQHPVATPHQPPGRNTKAAFTSTFWWPSEGNVVVAGCCLLDTDVHLCSVTFVCSELGRGCHIKRNVRCWIECIWVGVQRWSVLNRVTYRDFFAFT